MSSDPTTRFEFHRAELTRLAYRMTGSQAEAEDLVQEAWLRFAKAAEGGGVAQARPFLFRVVTRLCLDHLKSARVARETYPGPWLPEPIVEPRATPAEIAEEVTVALLLLLERLSPLERAVFLLRDVYDLSYEQIGESLDRSSEACRQLASRARGHVHAGRPRFKLPPSETDALLSSLYAAISRGDVEGIKARLCEDAVVVTDGGQVARAAMRPILGADRIARFLLGVSRKFPPPPTAELRPAWVNGLPGFVLVDGETCLQTQAYALDGERIAAIYVVLNPNKLSHVTL